ncbi:alpha/beta hydrolase [Microtetraspora sp. NBRC 13810]|uniref:alpha/beta hydrolase n=1 Tax=Microtetraspora sp. NBRC 13810 TaxID=3030990 RepID=UPI00249FD15D|nr:alpha/beta fold hydrolase [Microtetraspora sp. NBRC 13810]GLW13023.1 alpha/beta hydrolase [Microtetraspora sp. NBRC 13810]
MAGWLWRAAAAAGGVAILIVGMAWAFQRKLIYLPDHGAVPPAASVLPGARDVTLTTRDGLRLAAWTVPAAEPRRGVWVLVAGGNAGNRAGRAPLAKVLAERGLDVLLMDYRGYGGNEGAPDEAGLALDVRAAREHLLRTGEPVIYFGESLGAAVVTELAAEHPPDALLLRSPFTDLADAGQANYPFLPVRPLLGERYPLAELITRVRVPTTILYGTRDRTVPAALSRAVVAAARTAGGRVRAIEIEGAGHNDVAFVYGRELVEAVTDLADEIT